MQNIPKVILVIESSSAFGRRLLVGITKYARIHGPWAFYSTQDGIQSNLPKLRGPEADGIIMYEASGFRKLINLGKPYVLITQNPADYPEHPTIKTDSKSISKAAANHLISRGLRNFAYCGFDDINWSMERGKYFQEILNSQGYSVFAFNESSHLSKNKSESEQKRLIEWLNKLPKPIGIMACNDNRGQHIVEACKIAGIQIPEDVSVIGVDNDDLICELCDPPLSSIVLDSESAGYEAAKMLHDSMNKIKFEPKVWVIKPTYIKVRNSTDIMATQDKELVKAINFIKQNFSKNIQVEDVVDSTALSRRSLELRFREKLRRTINAEIRRVRVEHISKLLIETNLSISEIAYSLGFSSVEHISRYFQREIGKSPREFRKVHLVK